MNLTLSKKIYRNGTAYNARVLISHQDQNDGYHYKIEVENKETNGKIVYEVHKESFVPVKEMVDQLFERFEEEGHAEAVNDFELWDGVLE